VAHSLDLVHDTTRDLGDIRFSDATASGR
jgi:hypothetical protein